MKDNLISVTIDADFREYMVNGKKILIGIVSGRALMELKKDIPNKPNPREYMGKKNKYVPKMIKTLRYKPELFIYINNGIHITAESYIKNDDGTTTIFFKNGEGVYNGNHTKNVLEKYGGKNSYVIIAVYFEVPEDEIVDIIIGKNSSTPTKEISRGEKLDRYEWVKKILPDYKIKYKESDEYDLDIATVLHIAGIFQVDSISQSFINKDHRKFQSYLRSKGDLVKKHNDGKVDLDKTRFILKDLFDFYQFVRSDEECVTLVKRNLENRGWLRKGVITDSLMFNILNALNFALYIPEKTLYPCLKKGYDLDRLKILTTKVFPQIVNNLKKYEDEGLKVSEICREKNIYQEIQNIMLVADLEEKNKDLVTVK
ncbi:AIPR family protein [Bacillus sp. PS06]|uniref:AIPR family protein n=1 Tax=Bacillus sp. PS06 TaxID=2764176 RepID=UPI00177C687E|nr:AIPR family protein [Bacillus sp. PS06]MBD8069769.1 AIPR family protein [Bacillus sp. PS06]